MNVNSLTYCIERLKPLLSTSTWEQSLLAPFPKRTLATCFIRHRANYLARYESLTSPDLHYDMTATLSLPLWSRLLKIDETPVNIVEIVI